MRDSAPGPPPARLNQKKGKMMKQKYNKGREMQNAKVVGSVPPQGRKNPNHPRARSGGGGGRRG